MTLLIYSPKISERLKYICKQLFDRMLGVNIDITSTIEQFIAHKDAKISYATQPLSNEFFIPSNILLFEKSIHFQDIDIKKWKGLPCFFYSEHENASIPFDIFASSFYLITRYEEYLCQQYDSLGRFEAESSLAYQNKFLHLPLIDLWLIELCLLYTSDAADD